MEEVLLYLVALAEPNSHARNVSYRRSHGTVLLLTSMAGAVYVTRRDGSIPTRAEILRLLSPFGEVESVFFPSDTDLQMHDLQMGAWARFRIFGDCREAVNVRIPRLSQPPSYH
jgi:hypothetical protein